MLNKSKLKIYYMYFKNLLHVKSITFHCFLLFIDCQKERIQKWVANIFTSILKRPHYFILFKFPLFINAMQEFLAYNMV